MVADTSITRNGTATMAIAIRRIARRTQRGS
jgi:hypothetical protein